MEANILYLAYDIQYSIFLHCISVKNDYDGHMKDNQDAFQF